MASCAVTPWRGAYEAYGGVGWAVVGGGTLHLLFNGAPCFVVLCGMWYGSSVMAVVRLCQALHVWRGRAALRGKRIDWISTDELEKKRARYPNHMWMGWGFEWTGVHTQRLYDLQKHDLRSLRLPHVLPWKGLGDASTISKGSALLHAMEPVEREVYVPLDHLNGHVFVVGTTGALKTSLLKLLAAQCIRRTPRETVLIVDPKGDQDLRDFIRAECVAAGRAQDFAYFHPAFPRESVRIDPVANFTRATEIASRIAALIPRDKGADPWTAFSWRVLNTVVEGCLVTHGERPTLATIRRYVEGGVDELLHRTLIQHLERQGIDWRVAIEPYRRSVNRYKRPSPTTPDEVVALVAYYVSEKQPSQSAGVLDGLISMYQHDREHAQKMLGSLVPILTMLTAGELAGLLSPDRDDPTDTRPILNGASIVDSAAVLYMGLGALSDGVIASAIASIVTADVAAYAGARYNLGIKHPVVNLFDDEKNASVNLPWIQLLNKGRQAGYRVFFLSQTVADFVAALGNDALARQVLGNANSLIAGRCKDALTTEYVVEDFGKVVVRSLVEQYSTNMVAEGQPLNFTGSWGERQTETTTELVPPEAVAKLPDLEYFASFSGARIFKGRIPLLRCASASKHAARPVSPTRSVAARNDLWLTVTGLTSASQEVVEGQDPRLAPETLLLSSDNDPGAGWDQIVRGASAVSESQIRVQ